MVSNNRPGKANSFLVVVVGIVFAVATMILHQWKNEQETTSKASPTQRSSTSKTKHQPDASTPAHEDPRLKQIKGFVSYVQDGDSLILRSGGEEKTIRLWGIDAPEGNTKQPFAEDARTFTKQLCQRKHVVVLIHDKDRYHRFVGEVILPDGSSANEKIVSAGWAWHYQQHAPEAKNFADAERSARQAKRGLWAGENPIPPWDWRRDHPSHHR